MRFLGLDVGSKKTGISISDEMGRIAFPYKTIETTKLKEEVEKIKKEKKISTIILGESINNSGEQNPIMKLINKFANDFEKSGFVIKFIREDYSTMQSQRLGSGRDDEAATIILQTFLDRNKKD